MKKDITIGFLVSLVVLFIGMYSFARYISDTSFVATLQHAYYAKTLRKILFIAAIPNLVVFFLFLRKDHVNRAKGVLAGTILVAVLTLIFKFS